MRNQYTFKKDDNCISLYKETLIKDEKSKNYGKEYSQLIGHYSSIESLVNKLVFLELISQGTIEELLTDLKEVKQNVGSFVKQYFSN